MPGHDGRLQEGRLLSQATSSPDTTNQHRDECRCDGGQPKNFLRPCILLLLAEHSSHGYDLLERLKGFHFHRDPGGLYRVLRSLERESLVASHWVLSDAGPDRCLYTLTASGRQLLSAWADTLDDTRRMLDDYLGRFSTLSGGADSSTDFETIGVRQGPAVPRGSRRV